MPVNQMFINRKSAWQSFVRDNPSLGAVEDASNLDFLKQFVDVTIHDAGGIVPFECVGLLQGLPFSVYDYRFFTEEELVISEVIGAMSRHGYIALDENDQPLRWEMSSFGLRTKGAVEGLVDVMNVQNGATFNGRRLDTAPILAAMKRSGYLALTSRNAMWGWAVTHNEARGMTGMSKVAEVTTGHTIVYFC